MTKYNIHPVVVFPRGIMLHEFTDIKVNDTIETYEIIETARKL